MALKLYNPKTQAFATFTPATGIDLPFDQMLLLNILIEMQVQTQYLANLSPGTSYEDPQNHRTDIVSAT